MDFKSLEIIEPLLLAVQKAGYTKASEIQEKAIPLLLEGRDVLGCAQTGTGKTAAFSLPILQHLYNNPVKHKKIRALVLTPTRELALQVTENCRIYAQHTSLKTLAIYGGVKQTKQVASLKNGVDILVATPGRLLDLMQQGFIQISNIEFLVLDEADHMLDIGFIHDIKKILAKVPKNRQTLLFSATMPTEIRKLANTILRNPVEIAVTPTSSTAETVNQTVYHVPKKEKANLLVQLLSEEAVARSLVFTRTKYGADKLARQLNKKGIVSAAIHGNKSQNNRQRVLADFKKEKIKVLVATDIAARGIDIDELPHVVNFELPNVPETYVHRIGRTGRAGNNGVAISFCDEEQKKDLKKIQQLIGFKIKEAKF